MERHFDQELLELKKLLIDMASNVEDMIAGAIEALIHGDGERAEVVITSDKTVNRLELQVDEQGLKLLALRQPMAVDLRTITMAMKISTDLERMGDLSRGIARNVTELLAGPHVDLPSGLEKMAKTAQGMVRDCIDAFVRRDADLALRVCWRDDEVDALRTSIIKNLKGSMAARPESIDAGVNLVLVARALERVADHATNVAEDVVFMVNGQLIKHRPLPPPRG